MSILNQNFYERDTLNVAKDLLGKVLCKKSGDKILRGIIVETEAYTQDDEACHAYSGISNRCKSLFKKPGIAYVYFIYGMHYCFNISTYKENIGSGVLIRALEPVENIDNTNGPSKLCKAMGITKEYDGIDLTSSKSPLWIEEERIIPDNEIITTSRIGIKRAVDKPWRFYIKDNKWVSRF